MFRYYQGRDITYVKEYLEVFSCVNSAVIQFYLITCDAQRDV